MCHLYKSTFLSTGLDIHGPMTVKHPHHATSSRGSHHRYQSQKALQYCFEARRSVVEV